MSILQRSAFSLLAIFLLSGCSTGYQSSFTQVTAEPCISSGWPHDKSDLRPDPALTFGTLANGLRFVIMKNNEPEDRVGLYLNIQAGSLNESDMQQGYAHFLEHMLFNGTTHYPPGTLVEYFQSIGMSFGADTNAHTTFDETVYRILLPNGDRKSLEDGLLVMADYARGALLLEEEVNRERGIILAEKRTRDSANYRLYEKRMRFSFADTRVAERLPIGTDEALAEADSAMLRDYYDTWYRPENMILVVVGDVDKEVARKVIDEKFGELQVQENRPRCFEYGKLDEQLTAALYIHEPEKGSTEVSISTRWNDVPQVDSFTRQAELIRRYAAATLLNNRLKRVVSSENSPLTKARIYSGTFLERFGYTSITATATDAGRWQEALGKLNITLRQALVYGFSERELVRVRKEIRAELEKQIQTADSRDSRELASQIIGKLNSNEVVLSPEQDLELFGPVVANLALEEVNKVFRSLWAHTNRQYLVAGTAEINNGEKTPEQVILDVMTESDLQAVSGWENGNSIIFPYLDIPGQPGVVAEKITFPDIDTERVVFENGTVLNIKQTSFQPNEILVSVHLGQGRRSEPQPGMGRLAESVVRESGFGELTKEELEEALAGHPIDFSFRADMESFLVNATGLNRDLELMLQLIATQLLDPAFREDAYILTRERFGQMYDQMVSSVDGIMQLEGERFLAGGNVLFGLPPREQLLNLPLAELQEWLGPILQNAPLEVSVVGDVSHDKAVSLVSQYLGGLQRSKSDKKLPVDVVFPHGQKLDLEVNSEIDKAMVVVGWLTDDFWDISQTRRLNILSAVLDDRLRLEIREKLGAVYSPVVYNMPSRVVSGYGVLRVVMTVDPEQTNILIDKVGEVVRDLVVSGVSGEELSRSLGPTLTSIKDMMKTNRYWLNSVLSRSSRHPEQLRWPLTIQEDFAAISVEDVNELAVRYLGQGTEAQIIIQPVRQR